MPARVVMYRTQLCAYCMLAKRLLRKKGVAFEEVDISGNAAQRAWLRDLTGLPTVPQIFIDDRHIGGYLELHLLERAGKLDALLGGE